jgi:UDP-glucose 4-epimerase
MVLPRFVEQALGGGPITVYGNGSQTRSFAHVRDVVEALVRLAEHPAAVGQIYNVGNDQEIAIQELAHRVAALAKTGARIQYIPYEEAYGAGFEDLERRVPDLSKIREAIGYQPRTTLDEIILELLGIGRAGRAKKTEAVRSSSGTPA